jgi:hypothetical protein
MLLCFGRELDPAGDLDMAPRTLPAATGTPLRPDCTRDPAQAVRAHAADGGAGAPPPPLRAA